jgi:5,10-methylenetetrahydromethanopterin reductase
MAELWTLGVASPRGVMRVAEHVEKAGWDGLAVVDSQNLSGDCYVALAMAATVTKRIGLGTGVTNSVTRQAAATASAIASVQRISDGRAVLGIGRGDSALAHLGRAPATVAQFERYVRNLRVYLAGESVAFDDIGIAAADAPPVDALHLADTPGASRIAWIKDVPGVPIEVAATGPKVIRIAALYSDRVMFTLGADPARLIWGIELAKQARRDAGLDPDEIRFGAYLNAAAHPDIATARNLVRGGLTTFARFSVMHGPIAGPVSEAERRVLTELRASYDMRAHTRGDSRQAGVLTDAFIDHFAVVGTPEVCIERLRALEAAGLDKFIISGVGGSGSAAEAAALFERKVLPEARNG